jgi:hypothetical protein
MVLLGVGHLRGEIKPHLKGVIQKETIFFNVAKVHSPILETRLHLKDEFITILKHMNDVKQSPFALIVQAIIQRTFECRTNEL